MTSLGGPHVWPSLVGLVASAPHPHDLDRILGWLAEINPQRLRRSMLTYFGIDADPGLIEEAADGDLAAVRRILEVHDQDCVDQFGSPFEIPGQELRDRLVSAIHRFRSEVYRELEAEFTAAIGRAAAAFRATSAPESAKAVIEEVTKGLDYEIPLGISRVVLVPSVVIRPLSMIEQHGDSLVVIYGMADEFIDSDSEAPPSWLLKTYKALSDERRLRVLRRIARTEASLDDLVELLGLSKSTVHHHMTVLRAAGLVKVRMRGGQHGAKETYSLRPQSLSNAGSSLVSYVNADHQLVSNESRDLG
jgi:DNA-binding transcriptional ArsR family regulator